MAQWISTHDKTRFAIMHEIHTCPNCGFELSIQISYLSAGDKVVGTWRPPPKECPACGEPLEYKRKKATENHIGVVGYMCPPLEDIVDDF